MKAVLLSILGFAIAVSAGLVVVGYSGAYDVGADAPHWPVVSTAIESAKNRSIQRRLQGISPPDLEDSQRVLKGAGQYASMCVGCHLAPGIADSELRRGLYPRPPLLAEHRSDPRRAYLVLKHGIKMSGMPAWGAGAHDQTLWSLVAFIISYPA